MASESKSIKPLKNRLRSALVWGWVSFAAAVVGVPILGVMDALASFTTCSVEICGVNHNGDRYGIALLTLYSLALAVAVVLLVFGVRSLRKNLADAVIAKAARRVRTSSIVQLSILITPVPSYFIYFLIVTAINYFHW